MVISSRSNQYVKKVESLRMKKFRDQYSLFALEGEKRVLDALRAGHDPEVLFISKSYEARAGGVPGALVVTDAIMGQLSQVKTPQGILGAFRMPAPLPAESIASASRILYLDGVQDAENVGALVRTAVCAGYDCVVASPTSADFFSHKSVSASAASVLSIPLARGDAGILESLRDSGHAIIGADVDGAYNVGFPPSGFVLVLGNEGNGLTFEVSALCTQKCAIKIVGDCESLNVAVAGGLLMYKSVSLI